MRETRLHPVVDDVRVVGPQPRIMRAPLQQTQLFADVRLPFLESRPDQRVRALDVLEQFQPLESLARTGGKCLAKQLAAYLQKEGDRR